MRLARVLGTVTLARRLEDFPAGRLLICEALDAGGVQQSDRFVPRRKPMAESLVVYDEVGAGRDDVIAVSEGREAAIPWHPELHPVDAYCVAIIDSIEVDQDLMA